MTHCEYCGTLLGSDCDGLDVIEDATGDTHYVARCREYVRAALTGTKRELAALRAEVERLRAALREADSPDCECPACGECPACVEANAARRWPRDCRICAGTCRADRRRAALTPEPK